MIKSSSDNYRKSSTECLVIDFCLYIAITFHNNLTETKIANESIMSVQSLNILHQLRSRVLFPGLHVTFGQTLDATAFLCVVSGFGQLR